MGGLPQLENPEDGPGCPKLGRREAVVRMGAWVVYLGALAGLAESCGGPPSVTDSGVGTDPTPTPSPAGTGTPTPVPTATPDVACGCHTVPGSGWSNLGIHVSAVPVNAVAYNGTHTLFLCHDSAGLYCMSSICTHAFLDMGGGSFSSTNLSRGFTCPHHGATFNADGGPVNGIGPNPLQHYGLTTDSAGTLYANLGMRVSSSCRC